MNQFIPKEILHFIQPSEKKEEIAPEEKKEDELSNEDRMYLMNKKIDHQIISSIYQNLSDKKNLMYNENQVSVNEYVYNDVELIQDYALKTEVLFWLLRRPEFQVLCHLVFLAMQRTRLPTFL